MSLALQDPELRHLRHTPAGADYVQQMTAHAPDQHTRAAFRELVMDTVPRGARLFDFGAGPGIDARYFAEQGFSVDAYDVDPRMRVFFAEHCGGLIASGRVSLDGRAYRDFLQGAVMRLRADLVIANFAPLNLVDDLRELFVRFDDLTTAQGKVLVSVLNPLFAPEMRARHWWRSAPRLWRRGEVFAPGPQAPHYRRLLRYFSAASAPHFRLCTVFRELHDRPGYSAGIDLRRGGRFAWLHLARYRFMFLLFEKVPSP